MLIHYLKIALRNLWKYKTQSIISIIGLAVGFVCFALSLLWIRYERSYDDFHEGADRIYIVKRKTNMLGSSITLYTMPYPLAGYLKQNFPEVEEACNTSAYKGLVKVDDTTHEIFQARVDSLFMQMFHVEIITGNLNFLIPESKETAITEELSKTFWGNADPIGQSISIYGVDYKVCAIIKDRSKHSNYPFQLLTANSTSGSWGVASYQTFIKLKKGVDKEAFAKKISEYKFEPEDNLVISDLLITSLTSLRYQNPQFTANVAYKYVLFFTLVGGLVILCASFNYLTLFVCRFKMRMKELSLRIICGASDTSLFALLSTEFILTLLIALLLGMSFIRLSFSPFQKLSNVYMPIRNIYFQSLLYVGAIILFSLFVFLVLLLVFRRRTLNSSIKKVYKNLSRKISTILQLIISIGFIFCTIVIMKQIYFLQHTDIGIDYKNKATISLSSTVDTEVLKKQLQQIPEITEAINIYPLIPASVRIGGKILTWDDMPATSADNTQIINFLGATETYLKFYNFRLLEGGLLTDNDLPDNALISESGAKMLGWNQPIGKIFTVEHNYFAFDSTTTFRIKGVVKDIYIESPTTPPMPVLLVNNDQIRYFRVNKSNVISLTYQEGQWQHCKKRIEELVKQAYPNVILNLSNVEEVYNKHVKSETALLELLGFVSIVCIIISVFGFFSLVSLTCEERQKEIAIRKINGASMQNILWMYFKEYFLLLAIGALIAFPAGYLIMKRWIEQYIQQTTISAWIYLSILLVLSGIIILCVGWRVYQVARQNPAEVVKAE